jgi:hypothetical protein
VFLSVAVRKIKSDDTLTDFTKLYGIATAAGKNVTLSENFANPDTLVSIALVLKRHPARERRVRAVPEPHRRHGIYAARCADPVVADALFAVIKATSRLGLDRVSLEAPTADRREDPNAPEPTRRRRRRRPHPPPRPDAPPAVKPSSCPV